MNTPDFALIRFSCPAIPDDISEIHVAVTDLLKGCQLSNFGKYVTQLENRLAELLGVKYVRTVPNATTGLMMVASTLPQGSEVLVPSFTFPATVHALVHMQLQPRFVDADLTTFNISHEDAAAKITAKTSAILAVHVFGNPCRIAELEALAQRHNLKLFFDAAAATGSEYHGRLLGANGDAEVFSLSGTKVVSAGEGGFIATNDEELAQRIDWLRNYGYNEDRTDCRVVGFNGKLSELPAILALKSLDYMPENLKHRRKLAEQYQELLNEVEGISFQMPTEGALPNYFTMALQIDPDQFGCSAEVIQVYLDRLNIETKRYFAPVLHRTSAYGAFVTNDLPHSEQLSNRSLCLPLHTRLQEEHVAFICEALIALQEKLRRGSQSYYRNEAARLGASVSFAKPVAHNVARSWATPLAAAQTFEDELATT
ncbi:MAG: DegT/DnrJ/EryC1/StrS family aminotransferase [candidate division KSB1 bacterium]